MATCKESNVAYPRPDFHRGTQEGSDWIDLNGQWDFSFDADDAGLELGWHRPGAVYDRTIRVPFPWESHAAWGTEAAAGNDNYYSKNVYRDPLTVDDTNYRTAPRYTIGWYRRGISVPEGWAGQRVILHIGAADWHVRAWVNGREVGEAESGYLPVEFDLTDHLADGENTLVLRVEDPQDAGDKPLGKQVVSWYTPTSGIWQPVWLAPRPKRHIRVVHCTPNVCNGEVTVAVECAGAEGGAAVWAEVIGPAGEPVAQGQLAPAGDGRFSGTIDLGEGAAVWTPEQPNLHSVTVTLQAGDTVLDAVASYFGFRNIGVAPLGGRGPMYITLNGEPIYLKGALDQSFTPYGVYSYRDDEAIRHHLQQAVDAGFNFLRVHIKLEDPRYLYWADRLGILLQCDLPGCAFDGHSETARRRHETLLRGAVERDFNHPCIFSWCLFNETWGLGMGEYKGLVDRQEWVEQMYQLAKQLDATRLIEDNSACFYDHVVTDINSWHFYINDYEKAAAHIAEVVEKTHPGSGFNYVPGRVQGEQPLLNSEYGGIGCRMGDKDVSWCFKFLTDLLRREPKVCGYVYTELHDIEWEHNGIYNYDGSAKEFGYNPADLQADPYFAFEGAPGETVEPGSRPELPFFLARMTDGEIELPDIQVTISGVDAFGCDIAQLPSGSISWTRGGTDGLHIITRGAYVLDGDLPDYPCLIRLEARVDGRFADFKYLEVCSGRLPAVEHLPDGAVVLRKQAGEQEHTTGWHEAEVERGHVGRQIHLLGGTESGHVDYLFELPEDLEIGEETTIALIAELSSKMPDARQTEVTKWPTQVHTLLNGIEIDCRVIADQYADSRGALSHIHGLWGRHGELVRIDVPACVAQQVLAADSKKVNVRFSVPRHETPGGLIVYGSRAGRYPVDVTLVVRR